MKLLRFVSYYNPLERDIIQMACYDSFPGRPSKARAKVDTNCCRANLNREHVGSLLLDQWVEDKGMYKSNSM